MVNVVTFYAQVIRFGASQYSIEAISGTGEPIPASLFLSLDFPAEYPEDGSDLYSDLVELMNDDGEWQGDGWYCLIAERQSPPSSSYWSITDVVSFYGDDTPD